jgi:hypothetical protein
MNVVQGPYRGNWNDIHSTSSLMTHLDSTKNNLVGDEGATTMFNVDHSDTNSSFFHSIHSDDVHNGNNHNRGRDMNVGINNILGNCDTVSPIRRHSHDSSRNVSGKFPLPDSLTCDNVFKGTGANDNHEKNNSIVQHRTFKINSSESTFSNGSNVKCNSTTPISILDKISSLSVSDPTAWDESSDSSTEDVTLSYDIRTETAYAVSTKAITDIKSSLRIVSSDVKSAKRRCSNNVVRFAEEIEFREYSITVGEHPFCKDGLALTLDWESAEEYSLPFDIICKERNLWYTPPSKLSFNERRDHTLLGTNTSSIAPTQPQCSLASKVTSNDDDDDMTRPPTINNVPQSSDLGSVIAMLQQALQQSQPKRFENDIEDDSSDEDDDDDITTTKFKTLRDIA